MADSTPEDACRAADPVTELDLRIDDRAPSLVEEVPDLDTTPCLPSDERDPAASEPVPLGGSGVGSVVGGAEGPVADGAVGQGGGSGAGSVVGGAEGPAADGAVEGVGDPGRGIEGAGMATADGGRVLMVVSTVLAVFVVLALLGVLDWSLPLAGSHRQAGTPTSAGGRVFSGGGPKGGVGSWVSQRDVADLATELAASGWPSLALTVEGNSLQVSGTVANEQERADVITIAELRLASAPIVDRLTISTGDPAHVMVEVSQRGLTLTGTVPNEAMAEELATRAGVVYLDRQISNRLRVDGTVGAPMAITATGELTSERLLESVVGQFSGIVGVDPVLTDQLLLVEPTPIEDALNGFGEIRFASGSAVILSEAGPILDQIAVIMGSNPHTAVEIGGHTTDDDDSEALRALSQARADVVRSELVARGVSNELLANGYGGRRPGADGLDGTAAGSSPRSGSIVEFRVLD